MSEPDELESAKATPERRQKRRRKKRRRHLPALPVGVRLVVLVVGWVVVLIGIAGLALPGIQGCLTIAVGAALLSLASEMIYRGIRRLLKRWPKVMDKVEHFRGWMHDRISRRSKS